MAELKYTKHLLTKIEELFKELDYTVRYAKGNFQSGYCIVEHQNVAVINKFYETEGRINVLIDILDRIEIKEESMTEKGLKTYKQIRKKKMAENEEASEEEVPKEEKASEEEEVLKEEKASEEEEVPKGEEVSKEEKISEEEEVPEEEQIVEDDSIEKT